MSPFERISAQTAIAAVGIGTIYSLYGSVQDMRRKQNDTAFLRLAAAGASALLLITDCALLRAMAKRPTLAVPLRARAVSPLRKMISPSLSPLKFQHAPSPKT